MSCDVKLKPGFVFVSYSLRDGSCLVVVRMCVRAQTEVLALRTPSLCRATLATEPNRQTASGRLCLCQHYVINHEIAGNLLQ